MYQNQEYVFVVWGIDHTFGMFLGEFMETFGTTRPTTSMIASIQMGVTYFVGPVAANLVNRFGCCEIAIAGSIIAATSMIISGAAPNIATLYITAGFLTGNLWKLKAMVKSNFLYYLLQVWVSASSTYQPLLAWQPTLIKRGPLPVALQLLAVDLASFSLHLSYNYLMTTLAGRGP